MKKVFDAIKYLSRLMYWIAGVAIVFIVLLTVCDVVLRRFRMPISYTFELVTFVGAIAIGFLIPHTTLIGVHVSTDFVIEKVSERWKKILHFVTRCLGIGMFAIFSWRLFILGNNFKRIGDVTPILQIPMYPVPYIIGICCVVECLVLVRSLLSESGKAEV